MYSGTSGQEMFSTIMQWVCFITCLLILLMNLLIFFKRGRNAVSWEVCWVMCVVCESTGKNDAKD